MGCTASTKTVKRAKLVDAAVQRAADRCGQATVNSRFHRKPDAFEEDYVFTAEVLGSGVNGSVFKAHCKRTGRAVAVKSFRLVGINKSQMQQLEAETEIFLSMDHPHVAELMDVYRGPDKIDLVMECLSGGEVLDRLLQREENCFGEQEAGETIRQMLLAVNYIHKRDIVHRDLKLQNFLYETPESDHLKLIDFGFSKVWKADNRAMGLPLGSLQYVAPEVLGRSYGSKCDLWSMGVVSFVLLLGDYPFAAESQQETVRNIKAGRYQELSYGRVSSNAQDFVGKLLVVDPNLRMSAEEALNHPFLEFSARGRAMTADEITDRKVFESLKGFAQESRFRRACMSMAAWSLTNEEQARVRDEFLAIDESRCGTITLEEMLKALKLAGIEGEQADACFRALDFDKRGHIPYSEFLAAMVSTRITMTDEVIRRTFARFDVSHTGFITLDDLRTVLGESFEGAEVEELLKEADRENNGHISFEEFTRFLVGDPDGTDTLVMGKTLTGTKMLSGASPLSRNSRFTKRKSRKVLDDMISVAAARRSISSSWSGSHPTSSKPSRKVTEDGTLPSSSTQQLQQKMAALTRELEALRNGKKPASNFARCLGVLRAPCC